MACNDTKKGKDGVDELKKRLKEHMKPKMYEDDNLFLRFLKARDFNVDLAENMLRRHLKWREEVDIENIRSWKEPKVLEKYFPFILLGHDKEGCVVRYIPSGNIDWIGVMLSTKLEDLMKRIIHDCEEDVQDLKRQTKKLGKTVDKCVYIHNLENFSFAAATDKKVLVHSMALFEIYQNNYPEMLKAIYVINASLYFGLMFSVAKKCLSSSILNKIKIYNDDSYKDDLLEIMDADVLPAFLGGTRTDPDGNPSCTTFINHAGKIPESYYIHKSKRPLSTSPGVQKVTLSSAAFHEVNLEVKESGSYLEWEFETKNRDIGFGLFYREVIDGEEKNIPLIPIQRINTDDYAETGLYLCKNEGTYIMIFDNTYSWVRAKEVFFRVKIVSPAKQAAQKY